MMVVEDFKKDINNLVKQILFTAKQVEALKEEAQKSLKELQENTAKQGEALQELEANNAKQIEETHTHIHTKTLKNYRKTQPNRRWN
jgi:paraquat-inducible protein B